MRAGLWREGTGDGYRLGPDRVGLCGLHLTPPILPICLSVSLLLLSHSTSLNSVSVLSSHNSLLLPPALCAPISLAPPPPS